MWLKENLVMAFIEGQPDRWFYPSFQALLSPVYKGHCCSHLAFTIELWNCLLPAWRNSADLLQTPDPWLVKLGRIWGTMLHWFIHKVWKPYWFTYKNSMSFMGNFMWPETPRRAVLGSWLYKSFKKQEIWYSGTFWENMNEACLLAYQSKM